jgi:molecular chaperone GrpE (heat shock protein)
MNDDFKSLSMPTDADAPTQGMSSLYRLFEAFIALREKNERQHKLFEQTLNRARDSLQSSFNTFAADTQKAYQQLKQDVQGEKRFSLALLNELLDLAVDFDHILASRPELHLAGPEVENWQRWLHGLEVENRKLQDALIQFGIGPYDAVVGSPYNPALHERVGNKWVDGMDAFRVAEQIQRGYASQQPGFILKRPKVLVTE